jgi:hypothetical protein
MMHNTSVRQQQAHNSTTQQPKGVVCKSVAYLVEVVEPYTAALTELAFLWSDSRFLGPSLGCQQTWRWGSPWRDSEIGCSCGSDRCGSGRGGSTKRLLDWCWCCRHLHCSLSFGMLQVLLEFDAFGCIEERCVRRCDVKVQLQNNVNVGPIRDALDDLGDGGGEGEGAPGHTCGTVELPSVSG